MVAALFQWSGTAHAVEFDATGEASFASDASWTLSFEPGQLPEPDAGADAGSGIVTEADADALHGGYVLALGVYEGQDFPVTLPQAATSVRASAWLRGGSVVGTLEALDDSGRVDSFAVLYPTGRVTSDGWVEVRTRGFSVDPARITELNFGLFSPDGASVDASGGGAGRSRRARSSLRRRAGQRRLHGGSDLPVGALSQRRRSGARAAGGTDEADVAAYLRTRLSALFGPYENRKLDLPNALAEIDGMNGAQDAWTYWRHFRVAIHRLHDWHTKGNDLSGFSAGEREAHRRLLHRGERGPVQVRGSRACGQAGRFGVARGVGRTLSAWGPGIGC